MGASSVDFRFPIGSGRKGREKNSRMFWRISYQNLDGSQLPTDDKYS